MIGQRSAVVAVVVVGMSGFGWATWTALGQVTPATATPPVASARFEFLVVESFDAHYLGDTPGHMGRGSTGRVAPHIALGDPVQRGSGKVGTVTSLVWNEARESLEVEFSPEPHCRIVIGDPVWIPLLAAPPR